LKKTLGAVGKMAGVPEWAAKLIEDIGELKGTTGQILEQAKKTNGTVSDLKTWKECHEKEHATSAGAKKVKGDLWSKCYAIGEKVVIIIAGIWIGKVMK
jgi:hypothetical protein